jgi:hypothetical protein
MPNGIAGEFRGLDTTLRDTPLGRRLASVSYWDARVR